MSERNGCVVDRVLRRRHLRNVHPNWNEAEVVEALGTQYLNALADIKMFDIALSDLGAIKEMRPDLKDLDLAYLVRTADFDQDAEGWMLRVQNYVANSIDPCIHSPT